MITKLTRKPGQKGTKRLQAKYGDSLVCVRYRYDLEKRKRYKTVELIIEEVDWMPGDMPVFIRVAWGEKDVAMKVKQLGGRWDAKRKLWELAYRHVAELGLEERVAHDRSE